MNYVCQTRLRFLGHKLNNQTVSLPQLTSVDDIFYNRLNTEYPTGIKLYRPYLDTLDTSPPSIITSILLFHKPLKVYIYLRCKTNFEVAYFVTNMTELENNSSVKVLSIYSGLK